MVAAGVSPDARGMATTTIESTSESTSESTARTRDLTPDVARAVGLLGVAVVNAALLAPHAAVSTADKVTSAVVVGLLENRSWPMFALMFGFGIAAIAGKLQRLGVDAKARRRVLVRRNALLFAVGLAQVVLVFWGDILGVYGLTGMVVVALLGRSRRTLAVVGAISVVLWTVGTILTATPGGSDVVPSSPDFLASIGERLVVFAFWTGANGLLITHLAPMLVGVVLYRSGALHRPAEHLALHRRLVALGLPIGLLGAVPLILMVTGAWTPSSQVHAVALGVHAATGVLQGVAYVSAIALWSVRRTAAHRTGGPAARLAAVGSRSLTVYLVHSVLLGVSLSAWALDLAPRLSLAGTYGLGLGVWCVCAAVALVLSALGRPGPADAALRRLTYGGALGDAGSGR